MNADANTRRAGIMVPLFACPSTLSWGIGDIGDIAPLTAWLGEAGTRVLQILPLNEMATGQSSPYSAMTSMAFDPIYLRMTDVPEFTAAGGEPALSTYVRLVLDDVRRAHRVNYEGVREVKQAALRLAFDVFVTREWHAGTPRAEACLEYARDAAWWLDDYALFRALHDRENGAAWTTWPAPLRAREPAALGRARHELAREILFHRYSQWLADTQWRQARHAARTAGVAIFGDLPFMVDGHSADVWARAREFDLDVSLGVPPDAFSAEGQDWGMPLPRWHVMASGDYEWVRERARRTAQLFDGCRVDHLVGLYRTYGRQRDREPSGFFTPSDEPSQTAQGERLLSILCAFGAEILAEDLGLIPDFVRSSLERLGIPGFRVLRWERQWHDEGQPFRDPGSFPERSVATTGTHDTEPLAVWWDGLPPADRQLLRDTPTVQRVNGGIDLAHAEWTATVRDLLIQTLYASGSNLALLPIVDAFGWRDRINQPATVNGINWRFMLPWRVDRLDEEPEARERQAALRQWALSSQRDAER